MISLFILFGIGALYIRYLIFPFQSSKKKSCETLQASWKFFIFLLVKSGIICVNIDDKNRLENIKNSIIVSTHPSFVDIVILMSIIPHSTCFVAEKLAKNPFLQGMVKYLFILEGQELNKWVEEGKTLLSDGFNVIIFPMGTRHKKNEHPKIRRGASLLALESKKDIVLLNLEQDSAFLQIHEPFYKAGDKTVQYYLKYLDKINTEEYITKYTDPITFKTEVTKEIAKILYNN